MARGAVKVVVRRWGVSVVGAARAGMFDGRRGSGQENRRRMRREGQEDEDEEEGPLVVRRLEEGGRVLEARV